MYRVSPFTYLVSGMLTTGLANTNVTCSDTEYVHFNPTANKTCREYLQPYIDRTGGYVNNPMATSQCEFCTVQKTNDYLTQLSTNYGDRWRNFGIMWAYVIFNIGAALFFYWLARVPRKQKVQETPTSEAASRQQSRLERQKTKESSKAQ